MKILLAILTLSVLSCSSVPEMSEYKRGCYDGLDKVFKGEHENLKNNTCESLEETRQNRVFKEVLRRERGL